jgi:hypothetical protein
MKCGVPGQMHSSLGILGIVETSRGWMVVFAVCDEPVSTWIGASNWKIERNEGNFRCRADLLPEITGNFEPQNKGNSPGNREY